MVAEFFADRAGDARAAGSVESCRLAEPAPLAAPEVSVNLAKPVTLAAPAALAAAESELRRAGVPSPAADALQLLATALGVSPGQARVAVALERNLTLEQHQSFRAMLQRRCAREPLQHILGRAAFYNIELEVGEGVFTPRPETEQLLECALNALANVTAPRVLDLCTGSGAIGLGVAANRAGAKVFGVEQDPCAAAYARRNAERLRCTNFSLITADIAELTRTAPELFAPGSFDAVLSNPPYIPQRDIPADPEVTEYDPPAALYSGADGLDLIRVIVPLAAQLVRAGGLVAIEHTEQQGAQVCELLRQSGFERAATMPDLAGRARFSVAFSSQA
ncbi:peptide chain release factor N(5)-glutamine methyltransferase [Canibacter sp. lx-45]|uniref:peptide chain release factor N(5)-glutamine methyltransferase n=1 Tax=Canibacter zhuwentaonis TaxID=2837491 RepID=UPI001BDC6C37|nr:peptide chain release factor N(5)-glutamine methyltransferase [Canibacter zhuwentaonis]MBT1034789.1 peptide chain release factor N(5)-glutamine methyltransferase [Canibacter zhuwentaonis]